MSCSYFTQLVDLLAGRLAEHERLALEDHLTGCTLCEQELLRLTDDDEERRWREVLREASTPADASSEQSGELDPPEAFLNRLRTELAPPGQLADDQPPLPSAQDKGAEWNSTTRPGLDSRLAVTGGEGPALSVRSPAMVFSGPPHSRRPRRLGAY